MNNAKLTIESVDIYNEEQVDLSPWLRQREQVITETIEAIQAIHASSHWKVLQKNIFDGLVESLQKRLASESDNVEIHRLQGQIIWAMKYVDFKSLENAFRQELTNIRKQLNGKK